MKSCTAKLHGAAAYTTGLSCVPCLCGVARLVGPLASHSEAVPATIGETRDVVRAWATAAPGAAFAPRAACEHPQLAP